MGKMKELYIELQEKYGQDLEFLPTEFSYEEYLVSKSKELKDKEHKSGCCGGNLNQVVNDEGATWEDLGICPVCLDNC